MVLWQINFACVAGVYTPAKPVSVGDTGSDVRTVSHQSQHSIRATVTLRMMEQACGHSMVGGGGGLYLGAGSSLVPLVVRCGE